MALLAEAYLPQPSPPDKTACNACCGARKDKPDPEIKIIKMTEERALNALELRLPTDLIMLFRNAHDAGERVSLKETGNETESGSRKTTAELSEELKDRTTVRPSPTLQEQPATWPGHVHPYQSWFRQTEHLKKGHAKKITPLGERCTHVLMQIAP